LLQPHINAMIELNPIRQRIADLRGRLDSLRGYL
jgi:peptide chain release factor 2